jgi:hypothetical protein
MTTALTVVVGVLVVGLIITAVRLRPRRVSGPDPVAEAEAIRDASEGAAV